MSVIVKGGGGGGGVSFGTGRAIGEYAVGDSVYLYSNGTAMEFIVVHQGLPSDLYDSSCDGTWLLMNDIYELRAWDSSDNDYANSDIHAYLNDTFLGLFDSDIQAAIKQVKIPFQNGTGSGGSISSGSDGLSTKIFLLSGYEVGWTTATSSSYFTVDGACLSYFSGTAATDSKRIGYHCGAATVWWLRSAYKSNATGAIQVTTAGKYSYQTGTNAQGVRPALILDSATIIGPVGSIYMYPDKKTRCDVNWVATEEATITPRDSNQLIAAGTYFKEAHTVAGDANLTAANIKSGVSIFGIEGSLESLSTTAITISNPNKLTINVTYISKSSNGIGYYGTTISSSSRRISSIVKGSILYVSSDATTFYSSSQTGISNIDTGKWLIEADATSYSITFMGTA